MFGARLGVRSRILMIALIPSLTLLVAGVGITGFLVDRSNHSRQWTAAMQDGIGPTRSMMESVQQERRSTLAHLAGDKEATAALAEARPRTDAAMQQLLTMAQRFGELDPDTINARAHEFTDLGNALSQVRQKADRNALPAAEAYTYYSSLLDMLTIGTRLAERTAPDPEVVTTLALSTRLIHTIEAVSRSNALTEAALRADTGVALPDEYIGQVGRYHAEIPELLAELQPGSRGDARPRLTDPTWARLAETETALIQRSLAPAAETGQAEPSKLPEWQQTAAQVDGQLLDLWDEHNRHAHDLAHDSATRSVMVSSMAGIATVLIAVAAFGLSVISSNRLVRRLRRLRDETFALADEHLPDTMRRIRAGEHVDSEAESPRLDYGNDEIGAVATAFQHAHATAIAAAVTEARTRADVNAVFVNIAHRSQVVVHRQLEILDNAELNEEDPALLDTFFRLDHLATRERRNAENLVILGGGQPGRQWRNPVPVVDLVRSAIGETVDYARVRLDTLPDSYIAGNIVADLIHLLAELVDNAAAFSPPHTRVHVTGSTAEHGLTLTIDDQGMGMAAAELDQINERLRAAPDFGVASLSADSRLGLFVVARLASRHGVAVRLDSGEHGGIRATAVVAAALLAATPPEGTALPGPQPRQQVRVSDTAKTRAGTPAQPSTLVAEAEEPATPEQQPTSEVVAEPPSTPEEPAVLPDGRPALPRRNRKANLPARPAHSDTPEPAAQRSRSPEQARDLMSAIEFGTKQGREPLTAGTGAEPASASSNEQEG